MKSQEKVVLDVGGGERFTKWLAEYKTLFEEMHLSNNGL